MSVSLVGSAAISIAISAFVADDLVNSSVGEAEAFQKDLVPRQHPAIGRDQVEHRQENTVGVDPAVAMVTHSLPPLVYSYASRSA